MREDSGVALDLKWSRPHAGPDWLDEVKLRALGFRPEDYGGKHDAELWEIRRQAVPRRAYLVLEFDGPAWRAALAEREQQIETLAAKLAKGEATVEQVQDARKGLQDMRLSGSRLLPVDVGRNHETLRQRYGDRARYLIVAAKIGMTVGRPPPDQSDEPQVRGHIQQVLPDQIHVPVQHRADLQAILGDPWPEPLKRGARTAHRPRYEVLLNYGARHEPWISEIKPL
jgi:hypothetical protein